jgi:CBS domain-containing protein
MNLNQVSPPEGPPLVLKARTAADLMTPNPVSLRHTATAAEAAAFLTERGISAAPVIDEAGAPVGVLSQTDLVVNDRNRMDILETRRAPTEGFTESAEVPGEPADLLYEITVEPVDDNTLVRDLMTPAVFTVRLDASAARVVEDMTALRVRRLFVVDKGGVLVGVVTAGDVLRRLEPGSENNA